jgi:hypothetical protein
MTCFLAALALAAGAFLAGYWVSGHPEDTRSGIAKLRAKLSELFRKKEEPPK